MRRLWLPMLLAFVAFEVVDRIGHGAILNWNLFHDFPNVWRAMDARTFWFPILGRVVLAVMFVLVFTKGYEGRGGGEGLRFGVWMTLLLYLPLALAYFGHYRLRPAWVAGDFLVGVVSCLLAGWVVGATYKGTAVKKVEA